jgi:hypothetical protein
MCAWTSSVVRGVGYLVQVQVAECGESAIDSSKWTSRRVESRASE